MQQQARKFLDETIVPTLSKLDMNSEHAALLLLGTVAQESRFYHRTQLGGGPAKGLYQVELLTARDITDRYLKNRHSTRLKFNTAVGLDPNTIWATVPDYFMLTLLQFNDIFGTAIARLKYWMVPEELPKDVPGYAKYWKTYYNTPLGKGTEEEFIENWNKLVVG